MSADIGLSFGKPVDKKYEKYAKVYRACEDADVEIPKDILDFFGDEEPDGKSLWLNEDEVSNDALSGDRYEKIINIDKLPKDIKLIRVRLLY